MKKRLNKEFVIGLSVIAAIAILIFGIDYLKGINLFTPTNFYEVYYDNADGIAQSSPVKINGFQVGKVRQTSMDYNNPGKVKVVLALDKSLKLPEGTKAAIGQTLLSGAFIDLQLGKSPNTLKVGSTLEASSVPDLMTSLQNELMPAVGSILPKVDSLLYNLNLLASDPALAQSISRFDGITNNVLLASNGLNSTMGALNGKMPLILNNVGNATVSLDTITYNLALLSSDLRALPLQSTMDNVQRVTSNLEQFSAQLNNPNSTLGKLTNDPALYNQLSRVSADIDSLIVDIKKNPKRYISIKLL